MKSIFLLSFFWIFFESLLQPEAAWRGLEFSSHTCFVIIYQVFTGIMDATSSSTHDIAEPPQIADEAFANLNLSSHEVLRTCKRMPCPGSCGKQRRYYCCDCLIPCVGKNNAVTNDAFPSVTLPLHVHMLQARSERPQQSTAQHVALLAPRSCTLWRPFPECADSFQRNVVSNSPEGSVALLYVPNFLMTCSLTVSLFKN